MDIDADINADINAYRDALNEFYRVNYRLWHIMSSGQEIEKKNLSHQQVIDRCDLTPYESLCILREESIEGFRFRQNNDDRLVLASQQLILIWDSHACYVSYDNISSQRFQDFINTAKAWVSNGIPSDNLVVIRAALHLIYKDIQDQVQNLKFDVEDSWYSARALGYLGEKGSLLSSKSKKVMDDIFNRRYRVDGVQVVACIGPNELHEYKKLWDSIDVQMDDIRALLNTKLRHLKTRLVWFVVLHAVCVLGANVITAVRLAYSETTSKSDVKFLVFTFWVCFVAIYLQFAVARNAVRKRWLSSGSAIKED